MNNIVSPYLGEYNAIALGRCNFDIIATKAMNKDYDAWNEKKKKIEAISEDRLFFRDGEIWWAKLGLNIGYEMNGKGQEYTRPVLVLKKYNQFSFLALPLSTSQKINRYRVSIGEVEGQAATANLSQIRNVDSKRLSKKVGHLEKRLFYEIKKKARQVNFG